MKTLFILIFLLINQQDDWVMKANKNGVAIYVKRASGQKVNSVKSIVTINAIPEKIKEAILLFPDYPKWVYKCNEAHLIKKVNETEMYYYQYAKAPFTIKDRDLVAQITVKPDDKNWIISITAAPDYIPLEKNRIRIPVFNSTWKLIDLGNRTQVINEITTDPGGNIPKGIINSLITDGPYNTAINLKNLCEK